MLASILASTISTLTLVGINFIQCLYRKCSPGGPETALELPLLIIFLVLGILVIYPFMFLLGRQIGVVLSTIAVISGTVAVLASIFYIPEVDGSYINVFAVFAGFFGMPLVLGAVAGFLMLLGKMEANV